MRRFPLLCLLLWLGFTVQLHPQSVFPGPNPFSQSAEQLLQSGPTNQDLTASLNADFDSFGNRIIPLKAAGFVVPLNYQTELITRDLARNLGPDSLISYSPILPIANNPYRMRPTIDVLMRFRRLDVERPSVGYSIQHDTALPTQGLGEPVEAISQRISTELRIQTARDRPGRFNLAFGYRPNWINYIDIPELNTLDHQAFLQMGVPFQKLQVGYAATYSQSTNPSILTGAQAQTTALSQTLQLSYELSSKLKLDWQTGYNVSQQTQPLTSQLGANSIGDTTAISTRANLVFTKNEKVSLTTSLGYRKSIQDTGALAGLTLGGNRDTVSTGGGLSYVASEKLQMTLAGGLDFIKIPNEGEIRMAEFYELSGIYAPSPSWEVAVTVGAATTILATGFAIPTQSEFIRIGLRKNIFRQVNLSAAMETATETADSTNALASSLGRETNTYLMGISTPVGPKTTVTLNYTMSSIGSSTALLQQDNNTTRLELRHQF